MGLHEDLFGLYKPKSEPEVGPIEAAFRAVAWRLKQVELISQMDEETVTAAFLGGVTSAFPFCSLIFRPGNVQPIECSWGQFHKATKGSDDEDSEAHRGADFALVIWLTEEYARVAIFQAKKMELRGLRRALSGVYETDGSGSIPVESLPDVPKGRAYLNVHRRPLLKGKKPDEWREAQMVRLIRTACEVMTAEELRSENKSAWAEEARRSAKDDDHFMAHKYYFMEVAHWVHYLGYLDNDVLCVPLSSLSSDVLDKEIKNVDFKVNAVEITKSMKGVRPFVDLLVGGVEADIPSSDVPKDNVVGWKLMHAEVIKEILPELQSMMTVYVASGRGTMGPSMMVEMANQRELGSYSSVEGVAAPDDLAPTVTLGSGLIPRV